MLRSTKLKEYNICPSWQVDNDPLGIAKLCIPTINKIQIRAFLCRDPNQLNKKSN